MAILITGGTGSVGSGLARRLVEKGEQNLVLFDLAPRPDRVLDIKESVKIVQGDLTVWPEVLNVVRENNIDGIFHLGSLLSGACEANPWAGYQTVVTGTMHVLEAARLFDVKRAFPVPAPLMVRPFLKSLLRRHCSGQLAYMAPVSYLVSIWAGFTAESLGLTFAACVILWSSAPVPGHYRR